VWCGVVCVVWCGVCGLCGVVWCGETVFFSEKIYFISFKTNNMKKTLFFLGATMLFAFGTATMTGCGGGEAAADGHENHDDHEGHEQADAYACPMLCEGDKTYAEAGKCPKCEMGLEAVASADDHSGHDHGAEGHDDHEGHDH
jgi:hypothetical protein